MQSSEGDHLRRIMGRNLADQNLVIVSESCPKYTPEDWDVNNEQKFRISEDQEKLAERIVADSDKVISETSCTSKRMKKEVDHHLQQRTIEIQFIIDELQRQKNTSLMEEEALKVYRERVKNGIEFLKDKSLYICNKCIILREGRIGIDLTNDDVDVELRMELKVIKGSQGLLDKILEQTNETIRRLRANIYLLDRDLSNKEKSLRIDETNLRLRENQREMYTYHGKVPLDPCDYTLSEWQQITYKNVENTAKELNSATQIRSYIDILLKQVVEDIRTQTDRTNEAFNRRLSELRCVKNQLENIHYDTIKHIEEVNQQITKVEAELADAQGYLALCQMRLGNRAQRPGLELTCDTVQDALLSELSELKESVGKLTQKIQELKATLRYLLHAQMFQEEEINIKLNSIKIDEVDCMCIRQVLYYQSF